MSTTLSSPGRLDKLERIRQLRAHGLNTPRIELIKVGTPVDDDLRHRLRGLAAGDNWMTVRTYHSADEVGRAKGPFVPEVPVDEAIAVVEDLVGDWNVLFQEAIDVRGTVMAGNIVLSAEGRGEYEVLCGPYRVRDVDDLPPGAEGHMLAEQFESASEIDEPVLRDAVGRVLRSHLLEAVSAQRDEAVVLELNVQRQPVGGRRESILWWEWRPISVTHRPAEADLDRVEAVHSDVRIFSLGVSGLVASPADSRALIGRKAAGLAAAAVAGLPVPPAFVVAAAVDSHGAGFRAELEAAVAALGESGPGALGRAAAEARFAVRSSPVHSMPGMLDTVLDVEPAPAAVASAVELVAASWESERARLYRRMHGIGEDAGLAVIVQQMVLTDADAQSGVGVGFTRDPRSGDPRPVIEYLRGGGTSLVSGRLEPGSLVDLDRELPTGRAELGRWIPLLERIGHDVQEFEFAIERGRPFLVQMRPARQTAAARVRSAYGLYTGGIVDEAEAAQLLAGVDLERLERRRVRTEAPPVAVAKVASPGATVGRVALSLAAAKRIRSGGDPTILLLDAITTDDYRALRQVDAVVARIGGVTSHAAVVALEAGVVAMVSCSAMRLGEHSAYFGDTQIAEGDWVSVDGDDVGRIYLGRLPVEATGGGADLTTALVWAREAAPSNS